MTTEPRPFEVLVLCTANRCRSPLAELLLQDQTDRFDLGWKVSSAGIRAEPGLPPDPRIGRIITRAGLDLDGWRTSAFDPDSAARADLVLTATRAQRTWVVSQAPFALRKTVPLVQFAELCSDVRDDELPSSPSGFDLLKAIDAARGRSQPRDGRRWDIPDPVGRSALAFSRCHAQIRDLVAQIVRPLRDKTMRTAGRETGGW